MGEIMMIEIFDSPGGLLPIDQIQVEKLPPKPKTAFAALRAAKIAEDQIAGDLKLAMAHERDCAKLVTAATAHLNSVKPRISRIDLVRETIRSNRQ
jgi:hypothetical protein